MRLPRKLKVLVTAIGAPPGRNAVRALLKHENLEVVGTDAMPDCFASFPFSVEKFVLPKASSPDFFPELLKLAIEKEIDVIVPCIEEEVLRLSDLQDKVQENGICLLVPPKESLLKLVDKELLQQTAEKAGVPFLRSVRIESVRDLEKLSAFPLPFITKPLISYGAKGVRFHLEKKPDPAALGEDLAKYGALMAQTYVPGGAGSIFLSCGFFDRSGKQRLGFQSYSTKTLFDFGGPATAGNSFWDESLNEIFQKIMAGVPKWVGPVVLEFKKHEQTGEYFVMDANPRIWGYSSLADDSGIPFPLAYALEALDIPYPMHSCYLPGVEMERKSNTVDESEFPFSDGKRVSVSRRPAAKNEGRFIRVCRTAEELSAVKDGAEVIVYLSDSAPLKPSPQTHWMKPGKGTEVEQLYRAAIASRADFLLVGEQKLDFHDLQSRAWKTAQ